MNGNTAITICLSFEDAEQLRTSMTKAADVATMLSRSFVDMEERADEEDAADLAMLRNLANAIGHNLAAVWEILDRASVESRGDVQ